MEDSPENNITPCSANQGLPISREEDQQGRADGHVVKVGLLLMPPGIGSPNSLISKNEAEVPGKVSVLIAYDERKGKI